MLRSGLLVGIILLLQWSSLQASQTTTYEIIVDASVAAYATVDGVEGVATVPFTYNLAAGEYEITIRSDGYEPQTYTATVPDDSEVYAELELANGWQRVIPTNAYNGLFWLDDTLWFEQVSAQQVDWHVYTPTQALEHQATEADYPTPPPTIANLLGEESTVYPFDIHLSPDGEVALFLAETNGIVQLWFYHQLAQSLQPLDIELNASTLPNQQNLNILWIPPQTMGGKPYAIIQGSAQTDYPLPTFMEISSDTDAYTLYPVDEFYPWSAWQLLSPSPYIHFVAVSYDQHYPDQPYIIASTSAHDYIVSGISSRMAVIGNPVIRPSASWIEENIVRFCDLHGVHDYNLINRQELHTRLAFYYPTYNKLIYKSQLSPDGKYLAIARFGHPRDARVQEILIYTFPTE